MKDLWPRFVRGCDNVSIINIESVVNYKGFDIDVPTEMLQSNHCPSECQVGYQLKEQKEFIIDRCYA